MRDIQLTIANLAALKEDGITPTDAADLVATIKNLKAQADRLPALQSELSAIKTEAQRKELDTILQKGLADKKITKELQTALARDYAANPAGLKDLIDTMPQYQSIADLISHQKIETNLAWTWDDYEKNDTTGKKLKALKSSHPDHYQKLYHEKFHAEKENYWRDLNAHNNQR